MPPDLAARSAPPATGPARVVPPPLGAGPVAGPAAGFASAPLRLGRYRLDRSGRLLAVDAGAALLLGLPAAELIGRRLFDLFPSLRGSELDHRYAALFAGAGPQRFAFRVPGGASGAARTYAVLAEPVDASARPDAAEIRFADATEEHAAAAARLQEARLDAAAHLAGQLAHDVNNCLTVILGNAEMMSELLGPRHDTAEALRLLAEAAERAAAMTSRVLAFACRRRLPAEEVDVAALLTRMAGRLAAQPTTARDAPRIVLDLAPGLPPALTDGAELEAALAELTANALAALAPGGQVTLEAVARDGRVALTVADTGHGMPPELLAHCVEPFVTTRPEGRGAGLGLAVVHGFAVASGGALRLESRPGRGTRATLDLPAGAPVRLPPAPPARAGAVAPGSEALGHVLLVEDDGANRLSVSAMLELLGYRVTAVASAAEAMGALEGGCAPSLLLADLVLPGGPDGAGLVEAARRRTPGLPALLMSGFVARPRSGEPAEEGGVPMLVKPFRRADLARALEGALAGPAGGGAGMGFDAMEMGGHAGRG